MAKRATPAAKKPRKTVSAMAPPVQESEDQLELILNDFRNFVAVCYAALGFKASRVHYDVAQWLQHGPKRRGVTGHRGLAKSYLTAMYADWCLLRNPDTTVMCVSQNTEKAKDFVRLCRQLMDVVPFLHHLRPNEDQLDGAVKIECGARTRVNKDPSIVAFGITSMVTGSHADVIIPDDIETPINTETVGAREKLWTLTTEFENALNPGGEIIYLGTPHHRESLYWRLIEHGYVFRFWPAEYPDPNDAEAMERISPMLADDLISGRVQPRDPTHPERFPADELIRREGKMGPTIYGMQFRLDTRLADQNRYPLKLRDFIVFNVNPFVAPARIVWGTSTIEDIESVGFRGDRFNAPIFRDKETFLDYERSVAYLDPAGDGEDEMAWAIGMQCQGMIYIPLVNGTHGGPTPANILKIYKDLKRFGVTRLVIEENFGDGSWLPMFQVQMPDISIELVNSTNRQKELRIIDTLEPLLASHRIVIDPEVARDRVAMGQVCSITRARKSLKHEDRAEAIAGVCGQFSQDIGVLPEVRDEERRKAEAIKSAEEFAATWQRGVDGDPRVYSGSIDPSKIATPQRQDGNRWGGSRRQRHRF